MIKRSIVAMILVVVLLLAVSVAVASAQEATPTQAAATTTTTDETLKRLEVRNYSDNFLSIVLTSQDGNRTFVLWTPAGDQRVFTIPEGTYNRTTFACNESDNGTLTLDRHTRLVFGSCGEPPNWGEATMEKISITSSGPTGGGQVYGYD